MKTSAYKPTLTDAHLKRIEELKTTATLNEKQQKKLDVLTMTHSGEKRETIAEKLGINMDTITEWKKLFVKEGMEVYLGLQKAIKTA
jgi:myo-inositol catabolism protein IolC